MTTVRFEAEVSNLCPEVDLHERAEQELKQLIREVYGLSEDQIKTAELRG